jgi:hypothetical protein
MGPAVLRTAPGLSAEHTPGGGRVSPAIDEGATAHQRRAVGGEP